MSTVQRYIVDACVAVKWFLPEQYAQAAMRLRQPAYRLHVPDLFDLEFTNILCKKVRRQELELVEAREIIATMSRIPMTRHADNEFLLVAFDLANLISRSLYDCLYLALAIATEGRMVTADRKLYQGLCNSELTKYLIWIEDLS